VSAAPSGEQHELRAGEQRATVTEVGATLRAYAVGGRERIDGFAAGDRADGSRGQALLPWPNRIRDGAYSWRGVEQQLPIDEVALHNAIHGLVRWRNWTLRERTAERVELALRLHAQPGYPFTLDLQIAYELGEDGLRVVTRAENVGSEDCPFGAGFHPYLTLGGPVDRLRLTVPAAAVLRADERMIPTGSAPVAGSELDFRSGRSVGATVLDTCFVELAREADGRVRVTLEDGAERVALWMAEPYRYLMLYSGDTLAPERRRRSLAVEPMTCAPNAFATGGDGLITLAPGESVVAEWGIDPR
jgi:aldose 1-epimerase